MQPFSFLNIFQSRHVRGLLGPLLAFLCVAYFIYHSIQGERGLLSMFRTKQKLDIVRQEFNLLQSQKEALERRVYLLRPDSLDLDMLEERARAVLNFARLDEVIIFEEKPKQFTEQFPSAYSPYTLKEAPVSKHKQPSVKHSQAKNLPHATNPVPAQKSRQAHPPQKTTAKKQHLPIKHV